MKERPLLCTDSVVRNILAGRQTQDRRPMRFPKRWLDDITHDDLDASGFWICSGDHWQYGDDPIACPFGVPGDVLWPRCGFKVEYRETYNETIFTEDATGRWLPTRGRYYRKDGKLSQCGHKPAMHMPYWLSSHFFPRLEVQRVWIERVQSISEEDAKAEGVSGGCLNCGSDPCDCHNPEPSYRDSFAWLWNHLYGTWDANPWVWCCEFQKLEEQ